MSETGFSNMEMFTFETPLREEDRPVIGRLLVDTESMKCRSSSRWGKRNRK